MRQMQRLLFISILFVLILPVIAQTDLDQSYEWDDLGITIDYPDDWTSFEDENNIVHFTSNETDMFIVFEDYDSGDDLADYIETSFDDYTFNRSARFDDDDVLIGDLEDFDETASYFYTDELDSEEFERAIFAIPLDDDVIAIANVVPITDDEIEEIDIVLDILATLTIDSASGTSDAEIFEFDTGYELEITEDWQVSDDGFTNGEINVTFHFFEVEDERYDTRASAMRQIFEDMRASDTEYDEDLIIFIDLDNDEDAVGYVLEEDFAVIIIAFTIDNDTHVVAVSTPSDEDDFEAVYDYSEDFYVFIETLD